MIINEYFECSDELLNVLVELDQAIFDIPFDSHEYKRILTASSDVIVLIAQVKDEVVGFKVGYRHKNTTFYSMTGGVIATHRQMGIARALMEHQHRLLRERGYEYVRTHTRNKFKDMLIFNLSFGFEIIGVSQAINAQELSVMLEMKL
jgi:ribosomal protein S18 acetylase RimI-like enzyme